MKMDAKIDMLHRSGLFGKTPGKAKRVMKEIEEEEIDISIVRKQKSARTDNIHLS